MPIPTATTTEQQQPTLKLRGAKTQASTAVFPDLEAKGVSVPRYVRSLWSDLRNTSEQPGITC